jgi:hypothetical protein
LLAPKSAGSDSFNAAYASKSTLAMSENDFIRNLLA